MSGSFLFYLMRDLFKENVIVIPRGHGLVSRNTGETVLSIKKKKMSLLCTSSHDFINLHKYVFGGRGHSVCNRSLNR